MLGQLLHNRYRIDAELGRGGMGIVYQGFDTRLNRQVAIKVISNSTLGTEGRARLMVEAQAVARLNHPNIVTIFDAVDDETPYIVMELIEGKTLRADPPISLAECLEYARQICLALDHAHTRGIIHRDLKPENAFITPSRLIKLMDFGLARSANAPHVTQSGVIIGTAGYIAPELIEGQEPSPQSDLYALGVMLFEMLTGNLPYDSGDIVQVIGQHLHAPVPAARNIRSDIPEALDALVMRMMSKKAKDRPASALKVAEALAAFQSGQDQLTRPISIDIESVQSLDELFQKRAEAKNRWEKNWAKRGFPKSSLPVLEPRERPLILSNRATELVKGIKHLKEHRFLIVNGMPGIGKSTFARTLLEFMPVESPPPFWYDFERQRSSGNTLSVLLDRISAYLEYCLDADIRAEVLAFRAVPGGQASAYEVDLLIDSLNQETPIWLVFDNLETVLSRENRTFLDNSLEMLFDGLKSNTHNAKIIITNSFIPLLDSQEHLLEFGTQPLTLRGLSETDSITYLRASGLSDIPEEMLAALARSADGHPFTLNHIAHYIQSMGMPAAVENLQGGLEETTERFKVSLKQRLSTQEFEALQALAILHREISLEGLCLTAQTTPAIIKRLREEGLLQANDTGKFWLPAIVRNSLKTANPEAAKEAHLRATTFYQSQKLSTARQSIDDYASVLEWHHHAVQAGDGLSSFQALFSTGLQEQLMQWNEYNLLSELCEATLTLIARKVNFPSAERIKLHRVLGDVYFLLRNYPESVTHLKSALDLLPSDTDEETRIELVIYLAESHNGTGNFATARELSEQALSLLADKENHLKAKALHLRGIIHRDKGDQAEAIRAFEGALRLYETLNDQNGIASSTVDLGVSYYYQNQFAKAIANYRRAITSFQKVGALRNAMITHSNIGDILLQDEQFDLAIKELQIALDLARKKKITWMELDAGLPLVEAQLGLRNDAAAEMEVRSLSPLIAKQASTCLSGLEQTLLARIHWQRGEMKPAQDCFRRGLELLESGNCNNEQSARAYLAYALFSREQGQSEKAGAAARASEKIFTNLNNELGLKALRKVLKSISG